LSSRFQSVSPWRMKAKVTRPSCMMGPVTSDAVPASASTPDDPAVLRPSRAAYGRALRANLWIALPLLVVSLVRIGTNWWLLPFFAIVVVLTFAGVLLYFRNVRVDYRDGSYEVTSMFGVRRAFTASEATRVVTVASLLGTSMQGGVPQLIVLGEDGRKLLRLRGQTWDAAQLTELANDLIAHGVPDEAILEPISPVKLQERYPKAIAWWEAHQIAFGLLLGLAILVVVLLVVAVPVAFTSP
jgi:hypothetical protein